jgi:hypothetical protein
MFTVSIAFIKQDKTSINFLVSIVLKYRLICFLFYNEKYRYYLKIITKN